MFRAAGGQKARPVSGAGMPAWQAGCEEEEEEAGVRSPPDRQVGREGCSSASGTVRPMHAGIRTGWSPTIRLERGGLGASGGQWAPPGARGQERGPKLRSFSPASPRPAGVGDARIIRLRSPWVPLCLPPPSKPGSVSNPDGSQALERSSPGSVPGAPPRTCLSRDAISKPCTQIRSVRVGMPCVARWPAPLSAGCPQGSAPAGSSPCASPPAQARVSAQGSPRGSRAAGLAPRMGCNRTGAALLLLFLSQPRRLRRSGTLRCLGLPLRVTPRFDPGSLAGGVPVPTRCRSPAPRREQLLPGCKSALSPAWSNPRMGSGLGVGTPCCSPRRGPHCGLRSVPSLQGSGGLQLTGLCFGKTFPGEELSACRWHLAGGCFASVARSRPGSAVAKPSLGQLCPPNSPWCFCYTHWCPERSWVSRESDSFPAGISPDGASIPLEIAWRGQRRGGVMVAGKTQISADRLPLLSGEGDGRGQILLEQSK